jgi:hypothetical protein
MLPTTVFAMRCHISTATLTLCNPFASFPSEVEVAVVVYLHSVEGDGWPFTWWDLLLLARGGCVGSRLGWTWTWLLRKWLTGSDKQWLLGTFALKTFCRGVAIPRYYLSAWYLFRRLVSFASRTFRCCLLRGSTPGAALVSVFAARWACLNQADRQFSPRECASPLL